MKDEELRQKLTPEQYQVTQEKGTERPFTGQYVDNKEDGTYACVCCGAELFSSEHKYDSGSGWPSFTRPISDGRVHEESDRSLGMVRTEVRSATADSHLGHVFGDGPVARGGQRYCINSASLRFIPKEKLAEEGYADYLALFE